MSRLTFDAGTLKHLDAWLDEQFGGDTYRLQIRCTMLTFAADDVEYWSCQSWWNLFDHAKCNLIKRGY